MTNLYQNQWLQSFTMMSVGYINTLRPRQNGRHFADDIFKHILFNENVSISIKVSLKFVPKGPINNIPALVQIMAWHCPGDKPLSEPMMLISMTHICVTQPQWVKLMASMGRIQQYYNKSNREVGYYMNWCLLNCTIWASHEGVTILLPSFAINW